MVQRFVQKAGQIGYTLIETLVALGILVMGITASIALMVVTLARSQQNENMIVVVNLAREGLEVVRGIRDSSGFNQVFPPTIGESEVFILDGFTTSLSTVAEPPAVRSITECTNCALYIDQGRYATAPSGSSTATPYRRMVRTTRTAAEYGTVTSFIEWTERGRTHQYILETELYDWRD